MATNDPNQPKQGRQLALQVTHVIRKRVRFDDLNTEGEIGILPDKAIILRGNVYVTTAFSGGTLNIGVQGGAANEYLAAQALNATAIAPLDKLAIANAYRPLETVLTFARSAAATAGEAFIVVEYAVQN
ncbi:hypothetical protein [Ochrobactrum sp. EDr1-4]|uniref:hypothetical protein n=1 Tax=Ochrobactrum sp. EDr1-4 TaxID=3368622 RepID=UPI003BA1D7C0